MPDSHPAQARVRVRCSGHAPIARGTWKPLAALQIRPGRGRRVQVESVAVIA